MYAKVWYSVLTISSFISLYILLLYVKAANTENGAVTEGEKASQLNRNHLSDRFFPGGDRLANIILQHHPYYFIKDTLQNSPFQESPWVCYVRKKS